MDIVYIGIGVAKNVFAVDGGCAQQARADSPERATSQAGRVDRLPVAMHGGDGGLLG